MLARRIETLVILAGDTDSDYDGNHSLDKHLALQARRNSTSLSMVSKRVVV